MHGHLRVPYVLPRLSKRQDMTRRPPAGPGSWMTPEDRATRRAAIEVGRFTVEDAVAHLKREMNAIVRLSREVEADPVGGVLLPRYLARAREGIEDLEAALGVQHPRYGEWCAAGERTDEQVDRGDTTDRSSATR